MKGTFVMEEFLWLVFLPIGIIYSLWRLTGGNEQAGESGGEGFFACRKDRELQVPNAEAQIDFLYYRGFTRTVCVLREKRDENRGNIETARNRAVDAWRPSNNLCWPQSGAKLVMELV